MPANLLAVSPERALPRRNPLKEDCHAAGWTFTELAQEQPGFASGDFLFWAFLQDLLGVFFFLVLLSKTKARGSRPGSTGQSLSAPGVRRKAAHDAGDVEDSFAKVQRWNRKGAWGTQWAKPDPPDDSAEASPSWRSTPKVYARSLLSSHHLRFHAQGKKALSRCGLMTRVLSQITLGLSAND